MVVANGASVLRFILPERRALAPLERKRQDRRQGPRGGASYSITLSRIGVH